MKRLILTALALVMVLALAAGCGVNSPSTQTEEPTQTLATPEGTPSEETASETAPVQTPSFDENNPAAVATLAGPTGMGMIRMFENPAYDISLQVSPDEITP